MNRRVSGSLRPVAGSLPAVLLATILLATMLHAQTAWQKLSTTTTPGGCNSCGMVYDSARDRVVLINGVTWEFDGKD